MGIKTGVGWVAGGATWNPWHGCLKVSPGCKFCYMYREKIRYGQQPDLIVRSKTTFEDPLRWARSGKPPKFCFTCSWSDFFIAQADGWRDAAWEIIRKTPQITYQILTKRPERIKDHLPLDWGEEGYPNVWLGISGENQKYLDQRIPHIMDIPCRIRFVSLEPLLAPIDLDGMWLDLGDEGMPNIDWVIAGGESGLPSEDIRPTHPDWLRAIRDKCIEFRKPFFLKQWGEWQPAELWDPRMMPNLQLGMRPDGSFISADTIPEDAGAQRMLRVGTKASGNTLDGKVWEQMPEIAIESHS